MSAGDPNVSKNRPPADTSGARVGGVDIACFEATIGARGIGEFVQRSMSFGAGAFYVRPVRRGYGHRPARALLALPGVGRTRRRARRGLRPLPGRR